jgi:hypothetical protein
MLPQERPKESGGRRTSFGASQAETENSPVIRGRFHFSAVQALLLERAEELQAQCARIWSVMRCAERAAPEYYRLGTGLLRTSWRPPARGRNRRAVIGPPPALVHSAANGEAATPPPSKAIAVRCQFARAPLPARVESRREHAVFTLARGWQLLPAWPECPLWVLAV